FAARRFIAHEQGCADDVAVGIAHHTAVDAYGKLGQQPPAEPQPAAVVAIRRAPGEVEGTPGAITQVEPGFQLSLRAPGEGCRPGRRVALDGREPGERLDRQGPGLAVVAEEAIAEGGTREAAGRETVDA